MCNWTNSNSQTKTFLALSFNRRLPPSHLVIFYEHKKLPYLDKLCKQLNYVSICEFIFPVYSKPVLTG